MSGLHSYLPRRRKHQFLVVAGAVYVLCSAAIARQSESFFFSIGSVSRWMSAVDYDASLDANSVYDTNTHGDRLVLNKDNDLSEKEADVKQDSNHLEEAKEVSNLRKKAQPNEVEGDHEPLKTLEAKTKSLTNKKAKEVSTESTSNTTKVFENLPLKKDESEEKDTSEDVGTTKKQNTNGKTHKLDRKEHSQESSSSQATKSDLFKTTTHAVEPAKKEKKVGTTSTISTPHKTGVKVQAKHPQDEIFSAITLDETSIIKKHVMSTTTEANQRHLQNKQNDNDEPKIFDLSLPGPASLATSRYFKCALDDPQDVAFYWTTRDKPVDLKALHNDNQTTIDNSFTKRQTRAWKFSRVEIGRCIQENLEKRRAPLEGCAQYRAYSSMGYLSSTDKKCFFPSMNLESLEALARSYPNAIIVQVRQDPEQWFEGSSMKFRTYFFCFCVV